MKLSDLLLQRAAFDARLGQILMESSREKIFGRGGNVSDELYSIQQTENARLLALIKAIAPVLDAAEEHKSNWHGDSEYCTSECGLICKAIAEAREDLK